MRISLGDQCSSFFTSLFKKQNFKHPYQNPSKIYQDSRQDFKTLKAQTRRLKLATLWLWVVVAIGSSTSGALAADTPSFVLQSNRWAQLTVPANASSLTVQSLFARVTALPAADYGTSWATFRYDASAGEYVDPGINGTLTQGTGFWMIQLTGEPVTLQLPADINLATTTTKAACAVDACTEVALVTQSGQATYNMIGAALATTMSVEPTRVLTTATGSQCLAGCSLADALGYSYIDAELWHYDGASEAYVDLAEVGRIAPWQSVWLQTGSALPAAGATVLFPARSAPPVGSDTEDAARLLAQASFGPSMPAINEVMQLGIEGWVDNQLTLKGDSHLGFSQTNYPGAGSLTGPRQRKWLLDAIDGEDQLRLRAAFAFSEIFVVSDVPETLTKTQWGMTNYYDILRDEAFGNFRTILERITLSPVMGIYLSMMQNEKGDPELDTRADENFAREVMQLFTIGLSELNLDGTVKVDGSGNPIPAYTQADVEEYARVYTGWAYNNVDRWGRVPGDGNTNKLDPMTPFPGYHDEGAKNLLRGVVSPAGATTEQDLANALDSLFNHPNVGPYIGKLLIQRLVTSNPTPAYVSRVATVFNNNGAGVRGDLSAVFKAILLDPEAREGYVNVPNFGKLREPLLRWTHLWRAFNVQRGTESKFGEYNHGSPYIDYATSFMGQSVLSAPSVFNFFHPDYSPLGPTRDAGLLVPEAEIYTQAYFLENQRKISGLTQGFYQGGNENTLKSSHIDIRPETAMAESPDALLDHLNLILLSGQMSSGMRQVLLDHLENLPGDEEGRSQRVRDAITLIMASPEYLVQK